MTAINYTFNPEISDYSERETFDPTPIPMAKCESPRLNSMEQGKNEFFQCFKNGTNLTLQGFYSSIRSKYLVFKIDYCNQTVLSGIFPGHTCRTRNESENMISDVIV
jgi:hypothetical protein